MRDAGRLAAAIEILEDFDARRVPLKNCLQDWGRGHRFAGAKDRAWISGLALDALRRRRSLAAAVGGDTPRALALAALRLGWAWPVERIAEAAAEEPHGPGALSEAEAERLDAMVEIEDAPEHVRGDYPEWCAPMMTRAFGSDAAEEGRALAARAPVDLRVNRLKTDDERAFKALSAIGAAPAGILVNAARTPAPAADLKSGAVATIPAYSKGWVEVQDLGSQIAACAAGAAKGAQVLDLCAGGGGKTLALSALMENTGQIYAYDISPRRLIPIFARLKRAGARNVQVRSRADGATLDDLEGRMDVVFVDAPCSGSGTWRRKPDSKWRFTESQLAARLSEQDAVLNAAARYVKPGGRIVYVTCSVFFEENEDRLAAFRVKHEGFPPADTLAEIEAAGLLAEDGRAALAPCAAGEGALRMSPRRTGTDGFFVSVLKKA